MNKDTFLTTMQALAVMFNANLTEPLTDMYWMACFNSS